MPFSEVLMICSNLGVFLGLYVHLHIHMVFTMWICLYSAIPFL